MNAKSVKVTMTFVVPLEVVKYQKHYYSEPGVIEPVEPPEFISGKELHTLTEEEQELYCLVEPGHNDRDGDYIWDHFEGSSEELVDYTQKEIFEALKKSVALD